MSTMEVEIPTEKLNAIIQKFDASQEMLDNEVRPIMEEILSRLVRRISELFPTNTGITRGMTSSEIQGKGVDMRGIVANPAVNAPALEYGFRPGEVFPPVDAIFRWIEQKGLSSAGMTTRQLAFVVARSISQKGTKPIGMFKTAFDELRNWIEKKFDEALQKYTQRFGE